MAASTVPAMRLVFTDQGQPAGEVHIEGDELVGPIAWVRTVEAAMRRDGLDAEAALRKFDGWSNGYVAAHLEEGHASATTESADGEAGEAAPKGREWPGWEHDEALADHYADALLAAVAALIGDPEKLAAAWLASDASRTQEEALGRAAAAALRWLLRRLPQWLQDLLQILEDLAAEAYLLGSRSAQAVITVDDADWAGWTPGDPDAARRILGKDGKGAGLRDMLANSDVPLSGIPAARMDQFAQLLADAVAAGDAPDTLARKLRVFSSDQAWAKTTARTETARAVSVATMDQYRAHSDDIDKVEWLQAGLDPLDRVRVCALCAANAAAGPIAIGAPFPSGHTEPPAHPNCRCAVAPWLDLDAL